MYSEAHSGWIRPPWYMHSGDQIIALLFSARVTSYLFHQQ